MSDVAALEVRSLCAGYGEVGVLHDVDLEVGAGECVALLGVNGAGKSTLLSTLAGLVRPTGGTIALDGDDVTRTPAHTLRRRGVALVAEGRELFPTLTVADNLRSGLVPFGASHGRRADAAIRDACEPFPVLWERRDQLAGTLSGGEQQMLAIARALVGEVRLLLLDEPSLGLSPIVVDQIYERLRDMAAGGLSMLLVEQHVDRALDLARRGYVLDLGRVVTSAESAQLTADKRLEAVYLGS